MYDFIYCVDFCCCIFSKDPFRGFELSNGEIIDIDMTGIEKADVAYKLLNTCHEKLGGFPSSKNLNRLDKNSFEVSNKECHQECQIVMRDLNEQYNILQNDMRLNEAKLLKEKKNKLLKLMDKKVRENSEYFYQGKGCKISIKTKAKEMMKYKLPNDNKDKILNMLQMNEISFDSASNMNTAHNSIYESIDTKTKGNNNFVSKSNDLNNYEYTEGSSDNIDLLTELDSVDNEIMYLEKKNKKPIDYILDRFGIQDEVLVRIIKVFESALNEVLKKAKNYYEDTIYFQFKISEKLKKGMKKNEIKKI